METIWIVVHIHSEIQQVGMETMGVLIQMEMDRQIRMTISLMIQLKISTWMETDMEKIRTVTILTLVQDKQEQVPS